MTTDEGEGVITKRIRIFDRIAPTAAGSRATNSFAMSVTWCAFILALVTGATLVLPTPAVAGPTPTPTPICMEPPAACKKNSDCCSGICSGEGGNKTCQPAQLLAPTPTPEESALPPNISDGTADNSGDQEPVYDDRERIMQSLTSGEGADFIVQFEASTISREAIRRAASKGMRTLGPEEISYKREEFLSLKQNALEGLQGVTVLRDYDNLPSSFVHATNEDALTSLLARPEIRVVHENRNLRVGLDESLPLIEQPAVEALGHTGAGTVVAILDTGVNYTLPDFNRCTSPGTPAGCRVLATRESAIDDNSLDDSGHGTSVSAIVARTASGAGLVVADVCDNTFGCDSENMNDAISWIIGLKETTNIVSVNVSIWTDFTWQALECSDWPLSMEVESLLAVGIQPIIITGNGATFGGNFQYGASWPGCLPGVVSVGAVFDDDIGAYPWGFPFEDYFCEHSTTAADDVACFSQTFDGLDLLAPGVRIVSIGQPAHEAGTSFAAPHVAGAWAVMKGFAPGAREDQILTLLKDGGDPVTDFRVGGGQTTSRLNLSQAIALPEISQPLMLGIGIVALWGLSFLRVRHRSLRRRAG